MTLPNYFNKREYCPKYSINLGQYCFTTPKYYFVIRINTLLELHLGHLQAVVEVLNTFPHSLHLKLKGFNFIVF